MSGESTQLSTPGYSYTPPRQLRLLSVVTAVLNEEGTVAEFWARVREALIEVPFELIVVDDGSTDKTPTLLAELAASDPRIKIVTLARNFGHQLALTAGLEHASGDAIVTIDGDLQDPPELTLKLLDHWYKGSDIVYARRSSREGETRFKLASARWFYRLFARFTRLALPEEVGDFRLIDRAVLDALLEMPERHRFLRAMTVWLGFTQTLVPYERAARFEGETKYPLRRMLRLSFDAVFSFSNRPLQFATMLGFVISGFAFLAIPLMVVARVNHMFVRGIPSTIVILSLLGGIQLITVGIIGEYVGRIYDEVKRRPLYVVRRRTNLASEAELDSTQLAAQDLRQRNADFGVEDETGSDDQTASAVRSRPARFAP